MKYHLLRGLTAAVALGILATLAGCSQITGPPTIEAQVNTADPFTAATEAAFKGDLAYVTSCVDSDPRYVEGFDASGRTLLHYAAEGGHVNVVTYLLEKGAYVYAEDENGLTAFDTAALSPSAKEVIAVLSQAAQAAGGS